MDTNEQWIALIVGMLLVMLALTGVVGYWAAIVGAVIGVAVLFNIMWRQ